VDRHASRGSARDDFFIDFVSPALTCPVAENRWGRSRLETAPQGGFNGIG